ncbi:hypothetical protein [Wenyingzhuangia sp. IMCC45574]
MKKTIQALAVCALSILSVSCGGSDSPETNNKVNEVEANKQKMEDNILNLYDVVGDFNSEETSAIEINAFLKQMNVSNFNPKEIQSVELALKSMGVIKESIDSKSSRIPTIGAIDGEDSSAILEGFKENTGTYIWNESTGDFDFTWADSGKIVISISEDGKNFVLTISEFDTLVHDSWDEIPTSLKMVLTVNGETHFTHNYVVSIDNDKYLPNSVFNEIIIGKGDLVYKTEFSKSDDNKETSGFTTLQIGNTLVFSTELSTKGDFSPLNDGTPEDIEDNPIEDFLSLANANISMGKTKIKFDIAPKGDVEFDTLEEDINLLNEHVKISLLFDEEQIATGRFIEGSNIELVFEDGTTSSLEAYFGETFKDFYSRLKAD